MQRWCAECGDQFDPVEYRIPDPDEPAFCSSECEDDYYEAMMVEQVIAEAGSAGSLF